MLLPARQARVNVGRRIPGGGGAFIIIMIIIIIIIYLFFCGGGGWGEGAARHPPEESHSSWHADAHTTGPVPFRPPPCAPASRAASASASQAEASNLPATLVSLKSGTCVDQYRNMVSAKHFLMANNSLSSLEPGDGCCTGLRGGSTTPSVLLNLGEHRSDATQKSTLTPEIAERVAQK